VREQVSGQSRRGRHSQADAEGQKANGLGEFVVVLGEQPNGRTLAVSSQLACDPLQGRPQGARCVMGCDDPWTHGQAIEGDGWRASQTIDGDRPHACEYLPEVSAYDRIVEYLVGYVSGEGDISAEFKCRRIERPSARDDVTWGAECGMGTDDTVSVKDGHDARLRPWAATVA
jgi:hypothetical protein